MMDNIAPPQKSGFRFLPVFICLATFLLGVVADRIFVNQTTHSLFSAPVASSSSSTHDVVGLNSASPEAIGDLDFQQFWELWNLIKTKYYRPPVTDQQLYYGALSGLAESVDDPYTTFFEPTSATEFQQALSGKFEGIGAEIGIKNSQLQIVAPLPEMPAAKAGLMSGDYILKIDGQDTANMNVEKAVSLIRGPKDSTVTLNIFRPSQKKSPYDVKIVRDEIRVKSVTWKMLPKQIGYINVTNFNSDTYELFKEAVSSVLAKDPKGLVLDLRNDPGGFLEVAQKIAGEWVGDQVVTKERRQGQIISTLKGGGKARLQSVPTVVLVNQGSASASEIVAGALQDYGLAKLVGTKTFGKGSVQDYMTLKDGSAVKITIAEWLTPKERTIDKTGLDPDMVVDRTQEDYDAQRDPQLDRAVGILDGSVVVTSTHAGR